MRLRAAALLSYLMLAASAPAATETQEIGGVRYFVLSTDSQSIRIVWQDQQGRQLGTFPETFR